MNVVRKIGLLCGLLLAVVGLGHAATLEQCQNLRDHGRRTEARQCYQSLSEASDPYLRAEGYWGLQMYQQANDAFREAAARDDRSANIRVRWGLLLHQRFNNVDAEELFKEALQRDPNDARAYLGLALVSADGFDSKSVEYTRKALELDPKLVQAHELMANLALEDSNAKLALQQADEALQLSPDAIDAMAIHAAVDILADRSPEAWLQKVREVNPTYGEAYAIVAHHLELNYRYDDAIAYYRKALEVDPELWSARSELGVNLMRLGQDEEARQQLEMCYEHDYRDAATVNSLRLLDSEKDFVTFRGKDFVLRLDKKEADLLRPYFEEVLTKCISTYEKKYRMTLPAPVSVEVYPNHEDFAVRTMGMPGLGALGVTFGEVVAMDSPSARKPGTFLWASTLWHEMSHVFILTATDHRVPRWFTEGLAVHEETQASPEWGDPITPDVVAALRDKKLLPVAQLDRGFVRPDYPAQVIVSYFQAGRICDYIQDRWGADKLLDMVHSYARHETTTEAIQQNLNMTPAQFDQQFQAWLYERLGPVVDHFADWTQALKQLAKLDENHEYKQVLAKGGAVIAMYPQYIYAANAYEFVAEADLAESDKPAAAAILTEYEHRGGRSPDTLKELASIEQQLGHPAEAAATLDRINYIYPVNDVELHRHLGDLWFEQQNYDGALREYSAVLALHPLDKATTQFDLARTYYAVGQKDKAEDHLLASLEAAPTFRPAQKLLLELEDSKKGK